ncbi:hypothetical protein BCR44DRAFT_1532251 [Catenaria anguillulae PL171]|uniref:Meiosis-specific nuclear structural protein 1 n=1 Tax=Catenaria anguillulae PL171 TaxID=765915 RepID=A0A1Y2I1W7_9FUNG|nr:hypothetical protein BCR44DRAFT_1532251 [Catenaria anguillulae PL171]
MTRIAQEHKLEQQVQARKHREAQLWQKHMLDKQLEEQARTEKQTHNAIEHRLREQMLADAAKDQAERELATLTRKLQSKELAKSHREQVLEKIRREKEQRQRERETGICCVPNPVQTYSDDEMRRFLSRHFLELQQGTPLVGFPRPARHKTLTNAPANVPDGGPVSPTMDGTPQHLVGTDAPARPPGSANLSKRPGTASCM